MILRRLGNKKKLAQEIQKHFPKHTLYIEPFFGAGGMFFNKPKAKYNILNDIDSDVFNLFQVVSTRTDELKKLFCQMPVHTDLWEHWKTTTEADPVRRAVRFLFLSNYGYMGKPNTMGLANGSPSDILYKNIDATSDMLFGCEFTNYCFRELFQKIRVKDENHLHSRFIYCDPPYLGTDDNYSHSFTEADSSDLFDVLIGTGAKFAMSEFTHPFILEQAKKRNLNIVYIGERQSLKNRNTEILITNFKRNQPELF